MLETLKALCALRGVSGDEAEVRDYIRSRAEKCADSVETDVLGNLIVFKRGAATPDKKIMLCAHMDEVGAMVTSVTDDGYIKFACVGGIDRRVLLGKSVYIGKNRVYGVIGNKPIHLVKAEERKSVPKVDDMYIDIGAKDRESAEKLVSLGDTCAFSPEIRELSGGFIKAKAIDDRVGCAVMLKLIERDLPVDCTFVFTVQEEVGTRGAQVAAYRVQPDIALVLEGTTASDLPSVNGVKRICAPGKGVVIPFMDRGTIYDKELYTLLGRLADSNGIAHQTKSYIAGGTDGSVIQRSRSGVKTAGIAAPVRNIHTPACVAKAEDMEAMLRLAELFLKHCGEN